MSQDEVYRFLKKHKKEWFTSKEVAIVMKVNVSTARRALSKMKKHYEVEWKDADKHGYLYKYKEE